MHVRDGIRCWFVHQRGLAMWTVTASEDKRHWAAGRDKPHQQTLAMILTSSIILNHEHIDKIFCNRIRLWKLTQQFLVIWDDKGEGLCQGNSQWDMVERLGISWDLVIVATFYLLRWDAVKTAVLLLWCEIWCRKRFNHSWGYSWLAKSAKIN